jgi:hypothetical protein
MKTPSYYEDYLDEVTRVQVGSTSVAGADIHLSRWNDILQYESTSFTDTDVQTAKANQSLSDNGKKLSFVANFLNTPGSQYQPRSLYGIDWDLGDLLPIQYAGKNMTAEIEIVWVSLDESGIENIVGSNKVGE